MGLCWEGVVGQAVGACCMPAVTRAGGSTLTPSPTCLHGRFAAAQRLLMLIVLLLTVLAHPGQQAAGLSALVPRGGDLPAQAERKRHEQGVPAQEPAEGGLQPLTQCLRGGAPPSPGPQAVRKLRKGAHSRLGEGTALQQHEYTTCSTRSIIHAATCVWDVQAQSSWLSWKCTDNLLHPSTA